MGYTAILYTIFTYNISILYKIVIHLLQFIINNMAYIYLNSQISQQVIQQRNFDNLAGKSSNFIMNIQTNAV